MNIHSLCMRICFWLFFSLCSPNYAGVLSEHLIKRYEVQERHPKGRMSPALHNTDLEQKKPRRKDTPALHMSPFAAGKRAGAGCLQGMMGTGQDPYHLEVPQAWPLSWQSVLHGSALGRSSISCCLSGLPSFAAPPGLTWRCGEGQRLTHASAKLVRFTEPMQ